MKKRRSDQTALTRSLGAQVRDYRGAACTSLGVAPAYPCRRTRRRVRGPPGAPRRTRSGRERDPPSQSRPLLAPFYALAGHCAGGVRGWGGGHWQWADARPGRPDGPDGGRDWGSRGALAPGVSP